MLQDYIQLHLLLKLIFQKKCELCEEEIKSKSEMKKHMKTDSYKVVNHKSKECAYFCDNEY